MTTLRDVQERKYELLERYEAARLAEMLEELRPEAARQAALERFPWKGEFRSREEIEFLYAERRRWDRRFIVDLAAVVLVLALATAASSYGVKFMLPKPPEARQAAN